MLQRIVSLVVGFVLAGAVTELVLHALPYSTGYGQQAIDEQHPIVLGTPLKPYTYSRDWSFHFANSGVLNREGFRAAFDYTPDPSSLVVIGNSFVQADALTTDLRMTERLGDLVHRKAYALGIDGFSLADYLVASSWAASTFRTHTILVLLTTEDLVRSCRSIPGQHYVRFADGTVSMEFNERPAPSDFKRLLNRSSLFRYLFDNLHAPPNWVKGWRREDHAPPAAGSAAATELKAASPAKSQGCGSEQFQTVATPYLLNGFRQVEQANGARVVFVLAPDYYQKHTVLGAFRDVDAFADTAAKEGFQVIRLAAAFSAAEQQGATLSLLPIDGHWNAAANDLAARTIAQSLPN